MSRREPKAGEWLRQQIDELGALRNASVRDPQFKAWRQNTLTFIQRIWPGETTKSERFRRVPFTPPSTRHDARTAREYYERGCGEALEYLNALLASLGDASVVMPERTERHPDSFEGDFPEVDLGGSPGPVGAAPPAALDDRPEQPLDHPETFDPDTRASGPPELPSSAGRPASPGSSGEFLGSAAFLDPEAESPGNLPGTPPEAKGNAPRTTPPPEAPARPAADDPTGPPHVSVRGKAPHVERWETRTDPLKEMLAPGQRQEAERKDDAQKEAATTARNAKNGKKSKTSRPRLKDMLGLSSLDDAREAPPATPHVPTETPRIEVRRERTPSPAPEPVAAVEPPTPVEPPAPVDPPRADPPRASAAPAEPEAASPGASEPASPAFVGGVHSSGGWSLPEFMTPAARPKAPAAEAPHVSSPAAEALPEAAIDPLESLPNADPAEEELEVSEEDDSRDARLTAEFLDNSLVLSSAPRPAHRRAAETPPGATQSLPSRDSAASRLLAIAAEVDQLGVPEGHRARARAALMDLARQLDDHDVAWDVLREAIHFVMEFPPLARRALPLLLPFLDLAA